MANKNQIECPNCHRMVEAAEYCPHCGESLPKLSDDGADALISGYGNAVSELNNIRNTDSHDTHVSNTYVNNLSGEADRQRRRDEYKTFCEPILSDGLVTKEERLRLEAKARELKLTTYEAEEIENNVRKFTASPRRMNQIQEDTYKDAVRILEGNGDAAKAYKMLKPLVDKGFDDDGLSYHYYMAASLQSPTNYLRDYERCKQKYFSYWQAFWAYFAYKKKGEDINANKVMQDLAEAKDYPEDNATLLYVVDRICDQLNSPAQAFDKNQLAARLAGCEGISSELGDLKATLGYVMKYIQGGGVPMSNSEKFNLYLKLLGVKKGQPAAKEPQPKPQPQPESKSFGLSDSGVDFVDRQIRKPTPQPTPPPVQQSTVSPKPSQPQVSSTTTSNDDKDGWWKGCLIIIAVISLIGWGIKSCFNSCSGNKDAGEADYGMVDSVSTGNSTAEGSESSSTSDNSSSSDRQSASRQVENRSPSSQETPASSPSESAREETFSRQEETSTSTKITYTKVEEPTKVESSPAPTTAKQLVAKGKSLDGSSKTIAQAIEYYRQAANQGNAEAMYRLGCAYSFGNAATKDLGQAEKWFNKAISAGEEPWASRSKSKKVSLGLGGI